MPEVLTHNQTHESPRDALLHYGKKGMRWGVRNERRQEKADELMLQAMAVDIRAKEIETELAAATGLFNYSKRKQLSAELDATRDYRDHLVKSAEKTRDPGLSSGQKKLLIGAAIAGGLFLAYKASGPEVTASRGQEAARRTFTNVPQSSSRPDARVRAEESIRNRQSGATGMRINPDGSATPIVNNQPQERR